MHGKSLDRFQVQADHDFATVNFHPARSAIFEIMMPAIIGIPRDNLPESDLFEQFRQPPVIKDRVVDVVLMILSTHQLFGNGIDIHFKDRAVVVCEIVGGGSRIAERAA